MRKERIKSQPPKTVLEKLSNLPRGASPYERSMLRWFLKIGNYPHVPFEVKRVIDANIHIGGNANVLANKANVMGNEVEEDIEENEEEESFDIDLKKILSIENPKNSFSYLHGLTPPKGHRPIPTFQQLKESFEKNDYFMSDENIGKVYQSISLNRPLLISGPPGVGKSEAAIQIAKAMNLDPDNQDHYGKIFCTPETNTEKAIFGWADAKRLIDMQLVSGVLAATEIGNEEISEVYKEIAANAYGLRYLELRPLLRACIIPYRTVTLIDEADKPFPTFDNELLDILANFRYTVPEYGTVGRETTNQDSPDNPFFILTVNDGVSGGRDLSSMLMSRCTTLFLDYLPATMEQKIIQRKCVDGNKKMSGEDAAKVAQFFYEIRCDSTLKLRLTPSTREVIVTGLALVKNDMEVNKRNILELNCHWIKNRLDLDSLKSRHGERDSKGKESWKN